MDETNGAWRVIGAAIQGTAHQKQGLPCQDVQDYCILPGGAFVAALADGAGSAEHSGVGARCAVEEVLDALVCGLESTIPQTETAWAELIASAFEKAQAALQRLALETDTPAREYATTLACAVVCSGWLAAGQLGDGAVVAEDPEGSLFVVTQAQRGEYANETFFLTQEEALDQVHIHALECRVRALALMSDGLTRLALKMPGYEPHAPFFSPLFAFTAAAREEQRAKEQLGAFLSSDRVCDRTDDDKSLILAVAEDRLPPDDLPSDLQPD